MYTYTQVCFCSFHIPFHSVIPPRHPEESRGFHGFFHSPTFRGRQDTGLNARSGRKRPSSTSSSSPGFNTRVLRNVFTLNTPRYEDFKDGIPCFRNPSCSYPDLLAGRDYECFVFPLFKVTRAFLWTVARVLAGSRTCLPNPAWV